MKAYYYRVEMSKTEKKATVSEYEIIAENENCMVVKEGEWFEVVNKKTHYVPADTNKCVARFHPKGSFYNEEAEISLGWYARSKGRQSEAKVISAIKKCIEENCLAGFDPSGVKFEDLDL